MAVADVAKASGMSNVASRLALEGSLYKALAPAKPRYDTVLKVLKALGIQLQAVPARRRCPIRRRSITVVFASFLPR
jgi:DNA-binding phage protein